MRAAVLETPQSRLVVQDAVATPLEAHEVLVRVAASGLCRSDLSFMQAAEPGLRLPIVMGHEGVGRVEQLGSDVQTLKKGDRVIATWVAACGRCFWCLRGQANLCETLDLSGSRTPWTLADGRPASALTGLGTLAEAMIGSEFSFVRVETDLPDEHLALIGCAITTGVSAALRAAAIAAGDSVAVFGCGGVGMSSIQGARIAGAATVIAVDPVAVKREMAMKLGATHAIDPTVGDAVEQIKELTAGRGCDTTLSTAGQDEVATAAILAARRGGTCVCVSGVPDLSRLSPLDAKAMRFTLYGDADPRRDFPMLVSMVEREMLDLDAMVSRRITLDEVNDGFDAMARGEVIRVVVRC